jgi:hypothetical protein
MNDELGKLLARADDICLHITQCVERDLIRDLAAALRASPPAPQPAAAPAGEVEPVAWRQKFRVLTRVSASDSNWHYYDGAQRPMRSHDEVAVEPLYSAPPRAPAGDKALLREAREVITNLHQHGNWDNGVDGPNGENEGIIRTGEYVSRILAKLDAALTGADDDGR